MDLNHSAALRRFAAAPRPLRLPDLLQAADLAADAILRGHYDHLLSEWEYGHSMAWSARVHCDERLDIWLIGWSPDHVTHLRHRQNSLGALTVISGSLNEFHGNANQLIQRRLDSGDQSAFGHPGRHDVFWAQDSRGAQPAIPALSVHVHSPPLPEMPCYQRASDTPLRHARTYLTEHKEAS